MVEGEAGKPSDSPVKEETLSCQNDLSLALKNVTSDANVAASLGYNIKEMNP